MTLGRQWWGFSVTFSHGSTWPISSLDNNNTVKIWDASTGACIATLERHSGEVQSAAFPHGPTRSVPSRRMNPCTCAKHAGISQGFQVRNHPTVGNFHVTLGTSHRPLSHIISISETQTSQSYPSCLHLVRFLHLRHRRSPHAHRLSILQNITLSFQTEPVYTWSALAMRPPYCHRVHAFCGVSLG